MVPEGWEKKYLKDILSESIRNGFSPVASDKETGFWVLGLGSLGDEGINVTEIKPVEPTDRVLQSQLRHGDFLVSRSNTPDKVGRSIYFQGEIKNCSYPDLMMKFRINEDKANPIFIEQKLKSFDVRSYFKHCAAGSSSTMVKINKGILEKTPLLLPNIKEQKKIAQILSTWDKVIVTNERLLTNSQQQKKSLMQQLLTGRKRLSGFDEVWAHSTLKLIVSFSKGQQINRSTLTSSGEFPVINGGIGPSGYTSKYNSLPNTITISEGGNSCGYVSFQKEHFWCGGHCYALTNLNVDVEFMYHLLKFNEAKIMRLRVGSGLPNIQKKDLEAFSIYYPLNMHEQQKIANILSALDQETEVLQQKLHYLKQEKKALMQQLLTGKRRVKVEAA
ncbi:restriction endonuclease subunit S [Xenorhabdus bovienii]|uniref:restriction endonuclease subunit S n=1 Tax=Xenorhabdus bovienii TaxID=40576 RepID=UPI00237D1E87|nr:restriction endonuclease subunit S [Xenorhabdus bovienii]MDE1475682.1 restriction endonuclease subunit S [Xenorhabdus bovienii]MDE1483055.1 restriction endonuclease subunit S [Xenorhabdus bovienii]MDE1491641.1 restriction endonuclease subunit S [Xenorhabdus bovienii]MDE9434069.1 restriction endonuclease subunit S [Xenorhabdus bovienii]MDE9442715.1 restriction endonuclease subunit S [Xenorhabdus bovienii]